jgi:hypothetical protein
MELYFENWSEEFFKELKKTKSLRVISPFVQAPTIRKIEERFKLNHLELITRLNERDFALGVSSLKGLRFAVERGAKVYGIQKLHSKVYLFDKRVAIVTSANLTGGGLIDNIECGVRLTEVPLIDELASYFDKLVGGQLPVTTEQCEQIQKSIASKKIILPKSEFFADHGAEPHREKSKTAYYIKFFGKGDSKEVHSYPVRKYVNDSGCHYACTFSKRPRQVNTGDIVFISCMVGNPDDYAIFGRTEAIQHDERRDNATPEEIKQRPWKKDWPVYLRVKNGEFIEGAMENCPMLWNDVLREFDSRIFYRTKARSDAGEKGVDPKKSVRQKAYIRLSDEAGRWIDRKFQAALRENGAVDQEYLNSLPK